MIRVTASVVSTGEADRVGACLASLAAQRFDGKLSVVVVQNGVDDGTASVAARAFPGAVVVAQRVRRGFAENQNLGLAAVPFDYGIVLNPDVVLEPDCVAEMVAAMERHPRAGMIAPLLVFPSGAAQPSARRFPTPGATLVRRTPLRRIVGDGVARSRHYLPPPADDRIVDWALGACLCVREAAWLRIGGFDPGFRPLYVEDIDLAWRMWEAGWEVWQTPRARAMHEHQAVTDTVFFDRRTLWHLRGVVRFLHKHPRVLGRGAPRRAER